MTSLSATSSFPETLLKMSSSYCSCIDFGEPMVLEDDELAISQWLRL